MENVFIKKGDYYIILEEILVVLRLKIDQDKNCNDFGISFIKQEMF